MQQKDKVELFEKKTAELLSLALRLSAPKDSAEGIPRSLIGQARQSSILALEAILKALAAFFKMK